MSRPWAFVCTFNQKPNHYFVVFRNRVLYGDVKVGKGGSQVAVERLELVGAADFTVNLAQTKSDSFRREQLVYGCLPALIPDFFKPAMNERFAI